MLLCLHIGCINSSLPQEFVHMVLNRLRFRIKCYVTVVHVSVWDCHSSFDHVCTVSFLPKNKNTVNVILAIFNTENKVFPFCWNAFNMFHHSLCVLIYTDDYYTISVFLLVCSAWGICSLQRCIPNNRSNYAIMSICAQDNCILPASHHEVCLGW